VSPEPPVTSAPEAEARRAAADDDVRASQGGWIHPGRLPCLLAPEGYTSPVYHQRERAALFQPAWHFVGTLDELAPAGGFLTREILGTPILVRREGPEVRAFLNVCAHRHCRLTDLPRGADEDAGIVAQGQRGLAASPFPGQLSAREERIWAFQRHVAERCGAVP
jgi:hypothetical protein